MITPLDEVQAQRAVDAALSVNLQIFALASLLKGEVPVIDTSNNKPYTIGLGVSPDLDLSDISEVETDKNGNPKIFTFIDSKLHWIFKHPHHDFVKQTLGYALCAQVGFFYELIKACDSRAPKPDPVLDFFRHVRNAAFHGNRFNITSSTAHAEWRGRKMRESLNETRLFFDFLAPGDAYLLISDALAIAQSEKIDPIKLMATDN